MSSCRPHKVTALQIKGLPQAHNIEFITIGMNPKVDRCQLNVPLLKVERHKVVVLQDSRSVESLIEFVSHWAMKSTTMLLGLGDTLIELHRSTHILQMPARLCVASICIDFAQKSLGKFVLTLNQGQ